VGKRCGDADGSCLNPTFTAGKSNQPHSVGNPASHRCAARSAAAGVGFAFGVGTGVAGDSRGSRSLGERLPSRGGSPARGRSPRGAETPAVAPGRERTRTPCPAQKQISVLSCCLSLPSRVTEFEANNESSFPVVSPFSLPRWPVRRRQLEEIAAVLGGSSPSSASPPRSSPVSLPWGHHRVWGQPTASGTGAEQLC